MPGFEFELKIYGAQQKLNQTPRTVKEKFKMKENGGFSMCGSNVSVQVDCLGRFGLARPQGSPGDGFYFILTPLFSYIIILYSCLIIIYYFICYTERFC